MLSLRDSTFSLLGLEGLLLHAFMEQVVQTEKFWAYVSVAITFLQKKTFQGFLYIFAALKKLLQPTKSMQQKQCEA